MECQVSIPEQRLLLLDGGVTRADFPISTALNGANERNGSGGTPRGAHRIRLRIGEGCPVGSVFVGRRPTGEIYSPELAAAHPERDWILTRILWLTGLEAGRNRGKGVDTLHRYIYIHGTPPTEPMGVARSHGCIRMHDEALLELFAQVRNATRVTIFD